MLELCDAILGDHCPMPYRLIQLEIAQGENDECRYPPEAIEELADRHAGATFTITYAVANVVLTVWGPLIVGIADSNVS